MHTDSRFELRNEIRVLIVVLRQNVREIRQREAVDFLERLVSLFRVTLRLLTGFCFRVYDVVVVVPCVTDYMVVLEERLRQVADVFALIVVLEVNLIEIVMDIECPDE